MQACRYGTLPLSINHDYQSRMHTTTTKEHKIAMLWKALLLISIVTLLACTIYILYQRQYASPPTTIADLQQQLEQLGFYKYAQPSDIARLKVESAASGYLFGDERLHRDYPADAEDLAEGEVKAFIDELAPQLRLLGVRIDSVTQHITDDTDYRVTVNGQPYIIYHANEIHANDLWQRASTRTFALVNALLAKAGSDEQLYQLSGGNDGRAILLTPEMYATIKASQLVAEKNLPQPVPASQLK